MEKTFESVIQEKKDLGQMNTLKVIFVIARFGWLTRYQISDLVWPNIENRYENCRKILARLQADKLIRVSILASSKKGVRAYSLTPKGMSKILENHGASKGVLVKKTTRSITDSRYQYHRFLSNQMIIDMFVGRFKSVFNFNECSFFSEHEINTKNTGVFSALGCVPDGLFVGDETMYVIEVENSRRGMQRHGSQFGVGSVSNRLATNKLTSFLPVYIERVMRDGNYNLFIPDLINFDLSDCRQIFVCKSDVIFRSIWRIIDTLLVAEFKKNHDHSSYERMLGRFHYVVVDEPRWVEPLAPDNVNIYEHYDPAIEIMLEEADPHDRSWRSERSKEYLV